MNYTSLVSEMQVRLALKYSGAKKSIAELLHGGVLQQDENKMYSLKKSEDDFI